jgi:hypothetical protein
MQTSWDKVVVSMILTNHSSQLGNLRSRWGTEKMKPESLADSMKHVHGVDTANQHMACCLFLHQSVEWTKKVFTYIFQCVICSACAHTVQDAKPVWETPPRLNLSHCNRNVRRTRTQSHTDCWWCWLCWSKFCQTVEGNEHPCEIPSKAMSWLRWLVAGLSLWRPGFVPGSAHVGFVLDRVSLGQVFLWILQFSLSVSFHHGSPHWHITWEMNNRPINGCSSETYW